MKNRAIRSKQRSMGAFQTQRPDMNEAIIKGNSEIYMNRNVNNNIIVGHREAVQSTSNQRAINQLQDLQEQDVDDEKTVSSEKETIS